MYGLEYHNDTPYCLHHLTTREIKRLNLIDPAVQYRLIDYTKAHQWVKDGGIHTTGLYLDDKGRIRRSDAGC